ncbi:hypothetical protein BC940DRAFT_305698 [Gongronella butleri]|nr:hypothetical protein BC940DRAFT_305698 [Gongronella butleri]
MFKDEMWSSKSGSLGESNSSARLEPVVTTTGTQPFAYTQIEAIQHWVNGVDVSLAPKQPKDKKSSWLRSSDELKCVPQTRHNQHQSPQQSHPQLLQNLDAPSGATNTHLDIPDLDWHESELQFVRVRLIERMMDDDMSLFQFLDAVEQRVFGDQTLVVLFQRLPDILSLLSGLTLRTFSQLIRVLTLAMSHSDNIDQFQGTGLILQYIKDVSPSFHTCFKWYVQNYVFTADDLQTGLDFVVAIHQYYPSTNTTTLLGQLYDQFTTFDTILHPNARAAFQSQFDVYWNSGALSPNSLDHKSLDHSDVGQYFETNLVSDYLVEQLDLHHQQLRSIVWQSLQMLGFRNDGNVGIIPYDRDTIGLDSTVADPIPARCDLSASDGDLFTDKSDYKSADSKPMLPHSLDSRSIGASHAPDDVDLDLHTNAWGDESGAVTAAIIMDSISVGSDSLSTCPTAAVDNPAGVTAASVVDPSSCSLRQKSGVNKAISIDNVHFAHSIVLSPDVPDSVMVYEWDGICEQNLESYVGRLVVFLPDSLAVVPWQASNGLPKIGSLIHVQCNDYNMGNKHILSVKHQGTAIEGAFTLLLTSSPASPVLAALDWLNHLRNGSSQNLLFPVLSALSALAADPMQVACNNEIPKYLCGIELDLSCILQSSYRGYKANIEHRIWPHFQEKYDELPQPHQISSVYELSPSQVSAIQRALSQRVSVVVGAPGSGKTYLCGKLLHMIDQAIKSGFAHRLILVVAENEDDLCAILHQAANVDSIAWFGSENSHLPGIDVLVQSVPKRGDPLWNDYKQQMDSIAGWHAKLSALLHYRRRIVLDSSPSHILDIMPPTFQDSLLDPGYKIKAMNASDRVIVCKEWLSGTSMDQLRYSLASYDEEEKDSSSSKIDNLFGLMQPMMFLDEFRRLQFESDRQQPTVVPLNLGRHWPFGDDSEGIGDQVRHALFKRWSRYNPEDLWSLDSGSRQQLLESVLKTYDEILCCEIERIQEQLDECLASWNNIRQVLWTNICSFAHIVAMTADFAHSNPAFLSELSPLAVIYDAPKHDPINLLPTFAMLPQTEHLIVCASVPNTDKTSSEPQATPFWETLGIEPVTLTEQWRMNEQLSSLWHSLSDSQGPMQVWGMEMPILGVDGSAQYIELQPSEGESIAQFASLLSLYLCQQGCHGHDIEVFTLDRTIEDYTRSYLRNLASSAAFTAGLDQTLVSLPTSNRARQCNVAIILMDNKWTSIDLMAAVSNARNGIFVICCGDSSHNDDTLALKQWFQERGLLSNGIKLQCQVHKEKKTCIASVQQFELVPDGGCSEKCSKLLGCGHVCPQMCHSYDHSQVKCQRPCERPRPGSCEHPCVNTCHSCSENGCPPCQSMITVDLPCGHSKDIRCHDRCNPLHLASTCQVQEEVELACGHSKRLPCCKKLTAPVCTELTTKQLACGHILEGVCGYPTSCDQKCNKSMKCGHPCPNMCQPNHSHDRTLCKLECSKVLLCGHRCSQGCANPDNHTSRCMQKCNNLCSHGYACDHLCWQPCPKCIQSCPCQCEHQICNKKCYEECDRPPCNKPCSKNLLCGHPCRGLCGEPCTICPTCSTGKICPITLTPLSDVEENAILYTLPDCGCTFTLEGLDGYFDHELLPLVKLWSCPSCQTLIHRAHRYNHHVKQQMNHFNGIKEKQEKIRQMLSQHEKMEIINAMKTEVQNGGHDSVGGRWFVCKNGHPYFIGECGGATELSGCLECKEPIGGLNHRVIDSNRFYGDFDGEIHPAWPGQPGQPYQDPSDNEHQPEIEVVDNETETETE